MAKVVKKKKIKWIPFFCLLIVLAMLVFFVHLFLTTKIQNIIIEGNQLVSDIEIMESAGISDYPSFYLVSSSSIVRRLKANPLIKSVQVKRSFYHVLTLEIEEKKVLYKNISTGKYVLETGEEIALDSFMAPTVPHLINYVPNNKTKAFLKGLLKMKENLRVRISEITYVPNDFDKDRFLLYLDDGNMVYLTLTKFDMMNYYDEFLPQLEGKKGILYLDSGNHFKIMES